jgi:hypothetical protein
MTMSENRECAATEDARITRWNLSIVKAVIERCKAGMRGSMV